MAYVGCPTVADDCTLLSNYEAELQMMLDTTWSYSCDNHYTLNATKSMIIAYGNKTQKETAQTLKAWKLEPDLLKFVEKITHVGMTNNCNHLDFTVDDRIQTACRTAYSLMGAGFHGVNGLSPVVTVKMYKVYVQRC